MKLFNLFIFLSISLPLWAASTDLSESLDQLAGDNYLDRQTARDALYASAASVTSPNADAGDLEAFEKAVATAVQDTEKDLQTRIFLLRLLQRAGTARSADLLYSLSQKADEDPQLRDQARMALAAIEEAGISDLLVEGLQSAPDPEKPAWWQAVAYHKDPSSMAGAIELVRSGKLELGPAAVAAIGKSGGLPGTALLFQKWQENPEKLVLDLERALLLSKQMNAAQLGALIARSQDSTIRLGAFEQMVGENTKIAREHLVAELQQPDNESGSLFLRTALATGEPWAWDVALENLDTLQAESTAVILAAVGEQKLAAQEPLLMQYARGDNERLQTVALQALGKLASSESVPVLMELIKSDNEDIQELAQLALSQVDDPQLDQDLLTQVLDQDNPDRGEIIELLAIRNSAGAVETLNAILFSGESDDDMDALLSSLETIGNVDSCRIMAMAILQQPENQELRTYQRSLKRLAIRLAIPEFLWEQVFHPAIRLAPNEEGRASLVELLDCLSTGSALEYCTETALQGESERVATAADRAMRRWTNINIGDYWFDQLAASNGDALQARDAMAGITRLVGSDTVDASNGSKAAFAVKVVLEIEDEEQIRQIVDAVLENKLKQSFIKELKPYSRAMEILEAADL